MKGLLLLTFVAVLSYPLVSGDVQEMSGKKEMLMTKVTTLQVPIPIDPVQAHVEEVKPKMMPTPMDVASSMDDPCDLECTKMDFNPICASNGQCLNEFPNECIMKTHNCRHPMATFTMVRPEPCDETLLRMAAPIPMPMADHLSTTHRPLLWQKRCTPEEMMGGVQPTKV